MSVLLAVKSLARIVRCLALAGGLFAMAATPAAAFSDEGLIEGFVETVFGSEAGGHAEDLTSRVVKKFTGPVLYSIVTSSSVNHTDTVRRFMTDLSGSIQNLMLVEASHLGEADMVIFMVDRREYVPIIRATAWAGVDTLFLEENACSAILAARRTGIELAYIYLVADEGFDSLSHCMVEEVAQSLGPANDSSRLVHSIFNDDSAINVFGVFDWFILNILYDTRIRPGMTEADVRPLLPAIISDVRRRLPVALGTAERASIGGAFR
ncbi:MAG: DUF2927 domain-containing protein [Pseudomonadota bacterium]